MVDLSQLSAPFVFGSKSRSRRSRLYEKCSSNDCNQSPNDLWLKEQQHVFCGCCCSSRKCWRISGFESWAEEEGEEIRASSFSHRLVASENWFGSWLERRTGFPVGNVRFSSSKRSCCSSQKIHPEQQLPLPQSP